MWAGFSEARLLVPLVIALSGTAAVAQNREADGYTRYELLAPGSHKFRIVYEITAVTPGATAYYNPIRKGSIATDEHVTDRATGKPLEFGVVDAATAKAGGVRGDADQDYIRVKLARPVPADGGEGRVLIDKTYEDAKSYYSEGDTIVFDRSLGVKRNSVVLPKGYELVSVNTPVQVLQEGDGRIKLAFWNNSAAPRAADRQGASRTRFRRQPAIIHDQAVRRTRAPEPRDRLLSEPAGDAQLQPDTRLY